MHRRVSVVIPALNEARFIEACLESVFAQRVDRELEVIVVDGCSKDDTAALALAAGAIVVENPARTTPAGLNAGLAWASGEVIVRFDAHAVMSPGYVQSCLRALEEERSPACVGGWRQVSANGPWGRATAAALSSRLGVGNPRIWRRPRAGDRRRDVETVPLGCWATDVLRALGGWSERHFRNQDFELNHRLRRAGGHVVFDPAIRSIYHPRESLHGLVRQYWEYGRGKALVIADEPRSLQARQLAPLALLATVLTAPFSRASRIAIGLYVSVVCVSAARSSGGWRTAPVLAAMHLAWGAGVTSALPGAWRRHARHSRTLDSDD